MTHTSFANEAGSTSHNERLEFLGDSVLGLITVDWLYRRRPDDPEGHLSRTKSHLVSAEVLAEQARQLGLGAALRLGRGEDRSGGRDKPSLLACALEAIIGAVYLDGGLKAARRLIEPWLARSAEQYGEGPDAKSHLQELLQAEGLEPPAYLETGREGPDHDPVFHVECRIGGQPAASASGRSKKQAERRAAALALAQMAAEGAERRGDVDDRAPAGRPTDV